MAAMRWGSLVFGSLAGALVLLSWGAAEGAWFWARWFFEPLCHQIEGRCFVSGGLPWAACSRCSGIYGGLAFGGFLVAAFPAWARALWGAALSVWTFLGALALNGLDFAAERLGLVENALWWRFGDGLALGLAVAFLVLPRLASRNRA